MVLLSQDGSLSLTKHIGDCCSNSVTSLQVKSSLTSHGEVVNTPVLLRSSPVNCGLPSIRRQILGRTSQNPPHPGHTSHVSYVVSHPADSLTPGCSDCSCCSCNKLLLLLHSATGWRGMCFLRSESLHPLMYKQGSGKRDIQTLQELKTASLIDSQWIYNSLTSNLGVSPKLCTLFH